MIPTNNSNGLQMLAKPENGVAPRSRVSNPSDAYCLAANLVYASEGRISKGRMVKGLLDGNSPWDPQKLITNGQGWRANFATLEASGIKNTAKTPFYDLLNAASPLAQINLDGRSYASTDWSRKAAELFHEFFYGYPTVENHVWTMLDDFITFNRGFFWWPHPDDPYFKRLPWHRVMFPDGTSTDSEEWEVFAVKHFYSVSKLWALRGLPGYNKDAIDRAIARAQPTIPTSAYGEAMEVQQAIKDCDITFSSRCDLVRVISLYVKEFDGSWSHIQVEEDSLAAARKDVPTGKEPEEPLFLYEALSIYDEVTQIIAPFIYEVNEGSMNAFDGLGKQLFALLSTKDRLINGVVDGAFIRQYPLLQAQDAASYAKAGVVQIGATSILPPGLNVVQTNLMADLEGPIAVTALLDRTVESNTAIFKPRLEKPAGNPETATATSLRFQHASVLTSSAVNRFEAQMDRFLAELWRRATLKGHSSKSSRAGIKAAAEFQRKCEEAGIPTEVLRRKPLSVRKTRVFGNGSIVGRQQATQNLVPGAAVLGPRGRMAFWMDYFAAYGGESAVKRYFPEEDLLKVPGVQDWMADQENVAMKEGAKPIITEGQDHKVHYESHTMAALGALQGVQQGADPMVVLGFMQMAIPHIAEHISFIENNKDEQEQLGELGRATEQLAQQVQAMQQQQAQQQQKAQQLTFEQQLEQMKVQNDIQVKNAKNAAMMKQRQERAAFDRELADRDTAARIKRETALAAASVQRDNFVASSKVNVDSDTE